MKLIRKTRNRGNQEKIIDYYLISHEKFPGKSQTLKLMHNGEEWFINATTDSAHAFDYVPFIKMDNIEKLLGYNSTIESSDEKLTLKEVEAEIKRAFVHGQGNAQLMEAGLERDEIEDYTASRMKTLISKQNEWNVEIEMKAVCCTQGIKHYTSCNICDKYSEEPQITDGYINILKIK